MHARVSAIVVARNGAPFLGRTLAALSAQTHRPNAIVVVDAGSADGSEALLAAANPSQYVSGSSRASFGSLISNAVTVMGRSESANEWLWLLTHDNAPEPTALAELLGAVEVAPSVAVAGPKLMAWDRPDEIVSYGETVSLQGTSVSLVAGELDQAQHDRDSDKLAVAAGGMLVQRSVWEELDGFDPSLPSIDAALDFCIRVRLAGRRIVVVPSARVASIGGPELFGKKKVSESARSRITRIAQLHRRLAYAPPAALVLHWLSLFPLAVMRSVGHLLAKQPGAIAGEFSAALAAAVDTGVAASRANIARTRKLGWGAITPFRMNFHDLRELRLNRREAALPVVHASATAVRLNFFSQGGAWVVLFVAAIGMILAAPYFGATSLTGGALLPLSANITELWANVGFGWREVGAGFVGAADPFAVLLAILGSLSFWAPSGAIVVLYLLALPLAALAAWWCAARFAQRAWAPAVAAILWAFSPSLLASLAGGHLGAVLAHLFLPWLVLATVNAARSWSAAASAGLLFAATVASAPVIAPALVLGWFAWILARPRGILRIAAIPIPAAALFIPLIIQQLGRGNPLGLLADPGLPALFAPTSGWQLALVSPGAGYSGWSQFLDALGLSGELAPIVVAALLAPLAALAVLALFLPGSTRSVPSMVIALLGFLTAVSGAHLAVSFVGGAAVTLWPGAGLSLFWLGLVGAAVASLEALGRSVVAPALLASAAVIVLAIPLATAPILGTTQVEAGLGRLLPAFVTAEAANDPLLGTLVLTPQPDGALGVDLQRGTGTTLDAQSTLASTSTVTSEAHQRLAVLAGNLASRSGFDSAAELAALNIGFVVSSQADEGATSAEGAISAEGATAAEAATRVRTGESLDANPEFTAIGETANGFLWSFEGERSAAEVSVPAPFATPLGGAILAGQILILLMTFLLAVPTAGRARTRTIGVDNNEPASTFEGDDNA